MTATYSAPLRTPKGKLYDLNWYLTCKDWYMTQQVPDDHIAVHQNHNGLKKGFSSCTPDKLLTMIDKNRGIYEMITRFPHKFYADIDFDEPPQDFNQEEYLAKITDAFRHFLPDIEFAISGSVTEDRASYHLVAQNYTINNEQERAIAKLIAKKIHQDDDEGIDWKVYTKGRQMKCINQCKPKKTNTQLPITHLNNPKAHLITSFIEGKQNPISPLEKLTIPKKEQLNRVNQCLSYDEPLLELPNPEGILWDELTEPEHKITLLNLIPLSKDFRHRHTWDVMHYCICQKIPLPVFLKWLERKATTQEEMMERRDKYSRKLWPLWQYQFDKCEDPSDYEHFTSQYLMRRKLKRWYPNIEPVDAHYADFKQYMNPKNIIIEDTIDVPMLEKYQATKFVGLTQAMGTGKTTAILKYLRNKVLEGKTFLYVTHRVCVADDIYERMQKDIEDLVDEDLINSIKIAHYAKVGKNKQQRIKLLRSSKDTPNVITCLNSMHNILGRDKPFDYVVLDEVESMFNGICQVSTDRISGKSFFSEQDKRRVIDALTTFIAPAQQVFALDAFITERWVNFADLHNGVPPSSVIIDLPPPDEPPRTLITIENHENAVKHIVDRLKSGQKVFVSYPYKTKMEQFIDIIRNYLNDDFIQGRDYEIYHADVDSKIKKELGDVNKHWSKYKLILTNTVLTAGVSYTGIDVDAVYLFAASFSKPRDLIQVSMRCRALSSKNIYINFLPALPEQAWMNDAGNVERKVYTQLMKDTTNELKIDINRALIVFASKAHWNVDDPITEQGKLESFKQVIEDCKAKIGQLSWSNIEDITSEEAQLIERSHLINDYAPAIEKHQLRKFYFKSHFTTEVDPNLVKHIWDFGRMHVIKACDDALHNPSSFERLLLDVNNWFFFPNIDGEADSKKWKPNVPPEAKKIINKEFILRYEESGKKTHSLLRKVFNAKYGVEIIRRKKKKHGYYYETPNVDELESLYQQTKPYLKMPQVQEEGCQVSLQDVEA